MRRGLETQVARRAESESTEDLTRGDLAFLFRA